MSDNDPPDCILVYGREAILLGTRKSLLERVGFEVFTALEADDVKAILERERVAVLVLCHSLPAAMCEAALQLAEACDPAVRTLVLTVSGSLCAERRHDATVSVYEGPRKLVETVQSLAAQKRD